MLVCEANSSQLSLIDSQKDGEIVQLDFEEEGTQIKNISTNPDFSEFCVLFSYKEEDQTLKKASLGYIREGTLEDFDIIEIPEQVETIKFISNQDYLLAEGDLNFFVFETRNSELTKNIKNKISASMERKEDTDLKKSESESEDEEEKLQLD